MIGALIRTARPHQWVKNLFVVAPLVFAQQATDPAVLVNALAAFAAFCAASSAIYFVNDLADREADRRHPVKRSRPIAAGDLSLPTAIAGAVGLAVLAIGLGLWLGDRFTAILVAYVVMNVLYSARLKHVVILDVMIVSLGFVLRVEAGGAAIGVEVSAWLLLCTIFLALFLAFSKRRHELMLLSGEAAGQRQVLSHYSPVFLDQMINVVTASTVLAYSLYTTDDDVTARYGRELIVTIPFVLYGIFRYLYLIYQRQSELNPTEDLLRDPPFVVNLGLWSAVVLWILYGN